MRGYGFPAYFKRNVFVFFPSVLITEGFFVVLYCPSYMRNNEESGVLFFPVICYNINGISNRREIVSPRFLNSKQAC